MAHSIGPDLSWDARIEMRMPMKTKKSITKKQASGHKLTKALQGSLAEYQAGHTIGPFSTAEDAMDFLYSFQRLAFLLEKTYDKAQGI